MAEVVLIDTQVNAAAANKTLGEMEQGLSKANKELKKLVVGTDEWTDKAKEIAALKDEYNGVRESVNNLSKDNTKAITALSSAFAGATGALASATSVMTLFGDTSSDTAKSMMKVQASFVLLQSATQIKSALADTQNYLKGIGATGSGIASSFKSYVSGANASKLATDALSFSFKALGVGLIVAALAALVSNWDAVKKSVLSVLPGLSSVGEKFNTVKRYAIAFGEVIVNYVGKSISGIIKLVRGEFKAAMRDFESSINAKAVLAASLSRQEAEATEEANKKKLASDIATRQKRLEVLKAGGKETYNEEKNILQDSLTLHEKGSEEYNDVLQKIAVLDATHQKKLSDEATKAAEKRKAERQKEADELKKAKDDSLKAILDYNKQAELSNLSEIDRNIRLENERYEELKAKALKYGQDITELTKNHNAAIVALEKERADKVLEEQRKLDDFINETETAKLSDRDRKIANDIAKEVEKYTTLLQIAQENNLNTEGLEAAHLENMQAIKDQYRAADEEKINEYLEKYAPNEDKRAVELEEAATQYEALLELAGNDYAQRVALHDANSKRINEINKRYDEEDKKREKAKQRFKLDVTQSTLSSLSEIMGKSSKAGKMMAAAAATIETFKSAQQAFSSMSGIPIVGPALGAVAAAAAIAMGIKNVKSIMSTDETGEGGGGSVAGSASASFVAPQIPAAAQTTTLSALDNTTIDTLAENQTTVSVVEIEEKRTRVNEYENNSKL